MAEEEPLQHQQYCERQQLTHDERDVQNAGIEAALVRRRNLAHVRGAGSVFAADAEALQQPREYQRDRRRDPDRRVRWRERDQQRAEAHQHHRQSERSLASAAICIAAEHPAAERSDQKAAGVDRGTVEQLRGGIVVRKEQRREIDRARGIRVPVVPLDEIADRAAEDGAHSLTGGIDSRRGGGHFVVRCRRPAADGDLVRRRPAT